MRDPLRIAFMGTPDFAATALQALIGSAHEMAAVYSQPPRPKGRGQSVQKSPVHQLADIHTIPVFTPQNFKSDEAVEEFQSLNLDVAIVAAYGLILPKAILDAPRYGCLNIHASLLPRWRGAAPIQRAIWEGDVQTGITIMQMDEGLDTGAMVAKEAVSISDQTTSQGLHDELSNLGGRMIFETLDILARDKKLKGQKQPDEDVTYAHMLKKEDGNIDWSKTAQDIDRQVRALTPWPGTWCMNGDKRLKIHAVRLTDQKSDQAFGTIFDKNGKIACGEGSVLELVSIQPENKKSMDAAAALNGGYISVGKVLS